MTVDDRPGPSPDEASFVPSGPATESGRKAHADTGPLSGILNDIERLEPEETLDFTEELPVTIGRFSILRKLGHGGFGIVYQARDPERGCEVALKVPRPGVTRGEKAKRDLLREARTAATLHHPHIVKMLEVGEAGSTVYLASAYHSARPLSKVIADRAEPPPAEWACQIILRIAHAVQHAHDMGVLHLDIKPSNVLLADGPEDKLLPLLTDFGLAKALRAADESGSTLSTSIGWRGSPPYMAPEQVEERNDRLGPSTDVYGIGATFYELLTGRPPFPGGNVRQIFRQVLQDEPVPPRSLRRDLSPSIEAVCLMCLEKQPAHRYESASELIDDLEKAIVGKPTVARPRRLWNNLVRSAVRRPSAALALAGTVVAIAVILTQIIGTNQRLQDTNRQLRIEARMKEDALADLQKSKKAEDEKTEKLTRSNHAGYLRDAQQELEYGDVDAGNDMIKKLGRDEPPSPLIGGFAYNYLIKPRKVGDTILAHKSGPCIATVSADGTLFATAGGDDMVRVWDIRSRLRRRSLPGDLIRTTALAISPDGKTLVTGRSLPGNQGELIFWDIEEREPSRTVRGSFQQVTRLAYSPDGKTLAVGCTTRGMREDGDGGLLLWDVSKREFRPVTARSETWNIASVCFTPDSKTLATVSYPTTEKSHNVVKFWDVTSGVERYSFSVRNRTGAGRSSAEFPIAFLDDGKILAMASAHNSVLLLDHKNFAWKAGFDRGLSRDLLLLHFPVDAFDSPYDRRVDHLEVYDTSDPRKWTFPFEVPRTELRGGDGSVNTMAVSPDGKLLVEGGTDRYVRVWEVRTRRIVASRLNPFTTVRSLGFAGDAESVVITGDDSSVVVWNTRRPSETSDGMRHEAEVWSLAYDPTGRILASAADDHTIKLWDPETHRPLRTLTGHESLVTAIAFTPDGKRIVSGGFDGTVRLSETATGKLLRSWPLGRAKLRAIAVSPDGTLFAAAGDAGKITLHDSTDLSPVRELFGHTDTVHSLAFTLDGRQLASASDDHSVRIWNVSDGEESSSQKTTSEVMCLAYTHDGSTLAWGEIDGRIALWNLSEDTIQLFEQAGRQRLLAIAFTPDDDTMATTDGHLVRLWDTKSLQPTLTLRGHIGPVRSLVFSPDGSTLASCDHSGLIKLWGTAGPESTR